MAGVGWKRLGITTSAAYIMSFFFLLLPYRQNNSYPVLLNLQFLNFSMFAHFRFSRFDPMHIIWFLWFFHFTADAFLSCINENTSFLSMRLYRSSRNEVLKQMIRESLHDIIRLSVLLIMIIVSIAMLSLFWIRENISAASVLCVCLYCIRFSVLLLTMICALRIVCLFNPPSYVFTLPFLSVLAGIGFDAVSGQHLITCSADLLMELYGLVLSAGLFCAMALCELHFFKRKEVNIHD